jgi:hypothetical protein
MRTGVADGWPLDRIEQWHDGGWCQAQIDAAVAGPDPVVRNLAITLAHQELSERIASGWPRLPIRIR